VGKDAPQDGMRIIFIDGTTSLESIHDLETRGRGGIVTSLFKISDYLASAGHDVTVNSDIKHMGVTNAGVKWNDEYWGEYDAVVTNRSAGFGYSGLRTKKRILWTHDLPHDGFIPEPRVMAVFDRVVFLSKYAEGIWRTFYPTIGKSVFIPNGVDKGIFYPRPKDMDRLIYISAPNRGLEKLPRILDSLRSRVSADLELEAYSNFAKLHPGEVDDGFDYKSVEDSNVNLRDPVTQDVLASRLRRAALMILPSAYPETGGQAMLQSLACGTPLITTGNLGATPEWIKHGRNGMLTKYVPHDYMVHVEEMVRNAASALTDPKLYAKLVRGAIRTKIFDWNEIGRKWERMLERV